MAELIHYTLSELSLDGLAVCAYCGRGCKGDQGLAQHTMDSHPGRFMARAKEGTKPVKRANRSRAKETWKDRQYRSALSAVRYAETQGRE